MGQTPPEMCLGPKSRKPTPAFNAFIPLADVLLDRHDLT
jgi:hypothetical protein